MFPYLIYPWIPTDYDIPPTLYALLNSYVNFNKEEKTSISNLASEGRGLIFDFDYPLTTNLEKQKFEIMILNKFMMRRIGFDTLTAFKLALNVKLNEIMPMYNKLFDSLDGWNLFEDGEVVSRNVTDTIDSTLTNTTTGTDTSDRRYSNMPQDRIQDIKDGTYMTDYNFDTNESNGESNTKQDANNTTEERITRTPGDKISLYKTFIENRESIYSMIFKELDSLFYQII